MWNATLTLSISNSPLAPEPIEYASINKKVGDARKILDGLTVMDCVVPKLVIWVTSVDASVYTTVTYKVFPWGRGSDTR